VLHVPDVLILTLGMTYRYIHLLLHLANDMFLSRKSRILRRLAGTEERRLMAATSGILLGKSLQLSSEVYLAMESRGFRGYPHTIDRFQMRWFDWAAGLVAALVTLLAIVGR
jgi:energy-coupling factor transporter transmembrane protein EcfT